MNQKHFKSHIRQSIADENLQVALDNNARRRTAGRLTAFESLPDHQQRRQRLHAMKADVVAHLDEYVEQLAARVTANGIRVHRAADAEEAIRIFLEIAKDSTRRAQRFTKDSSGTLGGKEVLVAKSKSMVSEEINFNHALEAAGPSTSSGRRLRPVETDLGEYIVQLRGERPSHLITPAVHLRREQVGELFHEKLGIPYTDDIPTLTQVARRVLREVFLTADIGVSGVNVGVVETGTLCIVTNEGNGRMCNTLPPVHVALMGIERLVPTMDDLALVLSLLPRSATGQKLSVYTSLIHSPRRPDDPDGPLERHLILLDNGRRLLGNSPLAEALYCIRCGACLNACPVFRELGGHAYVGRDGAAAPYSGPIGSVISPGLFGCENFGQLAQASSLCGACKEACPAEIDLPGLLLKVRAGEAPKNEKQKEGIGVPVPVKLGLKGFRFAARISRLFAVFQALGGLLSRIYSPRRPYMRLPAWTGWGYSKDFPRLATRPFRARWGKIKQVIGEEGNRAIGKEGNQVIAKLDSSESPISRFIDEFAAIGGKVYRLSEKELPARLTELLKSKGIERVLVDSVGANYVVGIPVVRGPDPTVRAGVTGALCGIAESGSLVLVGGEGRPLTASLLPEIHVAILKESDIHDNLAKVLNLRKVREAAAGAIITGPSRTADIEMALTIGVHGPGEIHVFLVGDSGHAG